MLVLGGGLIYMIISRGEGEDAEYDEEEMDEQEGGEVPAKALPGVYTCYFSASPDCATTPIHIAPQREMNPSKRQGRVSSLEKARLKETTRQHITARL